MSVSHGTTRSSPTGTPRDHQASARAAATTAAAVRPAGAQCHDADSLHDPLPRRGRGIRKRGCATPVPAAMQWPRAGVTSRRRTPHCRHSRARCSFLSPSPLGGRGEGEGGCWRHLEPLGASPLCLRLRLRGASPLSLILSPGGGEESGKGGPCPTSVIPAQWSPHGGLPDQRERNAGMRDAYPCRGESRVRLT